MPLICSSSGVATVSAMTLGLAPGNCAFTTTVGGTTSGYSEIGSWKTETAPARKMRTEMTPAKIGRSMKKWEKIHGGGLWRSKHRDPLSALQGGEEGAHCGAMGR